MHKRKGEVSKLPLFFFRLIFIPNQQSVFEYCHSFKIRFCKIHYEILPVVSKAFFAVTELFARYLFSGYVRVLLIQCFV